MKVILKGTSNDYAFTSEEQYCDRTITDPFQYTHFWEDCRIDVGATEFKNLKSKGILFDDPLGAWS